MPITETIGVTLGIIAGIPAAVGATWYIVSKIYIHINRVVKLVDLIEKVSKEFSPNGGTSLKDAINRIEKRQIFSEEKQKAIFQMLPYGIFVTDEKGDCSWANRAYVNMVQRSIEEMRGKQWLYHVHPEDRELVERSWYDAVNDKREFDLTYRFATKHIPSIVVNVHAYPIFTANNELFGYIGTVNKV